MKSTEEYLEIASKVTDLAGEFAMENFGPFKQTFHKSGLEYGIEEDKKCNELYEKFLKEQTPEVSLYTEEGEKNLGDELTWTVDPIDGTSNYGVGNAYFNTQIALLKNREPILGIIYAPILKQKFIAVKDQGAKLNGRQIQVSQNTKLSSTTFAVGKGKDPKLHKKFMDTTDALLKASRSIRVFGSAGLELAYTAAGMIDYFVCFGANIWDYAPGVLLVKEAGGVALNLQGSEWGLDDEHILASNPQIAEQVLKLLK